MLQAYKQGLVDMLKKDKFSEIFILLRKRERPADLLPDPEAADYGRILPECFDGCQSPLWPHA